MANRTNDEVEVERCTTCGEPAHASETDDAGRCAPCMIAAGDFPLYPCRECGTTVASKVALAPDNYPLCADCGGDIDPRDALRADDDGMAQWGAPEGFGG